MTGYITRFAPSPTGNLHIGSARTALINFIFKSQNPDSKLYLRIDDTDKKRSNVQSLEQLIKTPRKSVIARSEKQSEYIKSLKETLLLV